MEKKYVCFGGCIISQSDGDEHYISAHRVAELYKVNPAECILIEWDERNLVVGLNFKKYKILNPKKNGNYKLN